MQIKSKRQLLALIFSSQMGEAERQELLRTMLQNGEITENDLAEEMIRHIERQEGAYHELFQQDELLQFLWERFRDRPSYLARALVRARPELFYCYGFAFRLCMKLRANLGRVWIKPRKGSGDGPDNGDSPIAQLPHEVEADIFALDLECRFREFLFFFARDFTDGINLLDAEIEHARTTYDRRILQAVRLQATRLIKTTYPGTIQTLHGHAFPALHVRWWLDVSQNQERVLNMGDTGSYKTAFAALSTRQHGCKKVLIVTAPHARTNWRHELGLYFINTPITQVLLTPADAEHIDPMATYVIIGYSTLIHTSVVEHLIEQQFDGLIQDESHYGNNLRSSHPAARALAVARLVKELPIRCYRALSATPWENHPEELASIGLALRPDLFTSPETFLGSGAAKNPRLLRELFAEHILEIELREVRDFPAVAPKPWEDLFGAIPIEMHSAQRKIYQLVYQDDEGEPEPTQKVMRLLMAAVHPPLLAKRMAWNAKLQQQIQDPNCSTKFNWIRSYIERRIADHKIIIGTGLYAEGITRNGDDTDEAISIATLLREQFGEHRVLVLDGTVAITSPNSTQSEREQLIQRWRKDPEAKILLVSMAACPDSVNLTVGTLPGIKKVAITALSYGWKPWKQFLSRFLLRQGQETPVEYQVPVLVGTIDEDLLRLNEEKWNAQQLFRALAPMTDNEWHYLGKDGPERLRELLRDSVEHVNILSSLFRGRGERHAKSIMDSVYGATTRAEAFARHFLESQTTSTWGDIANCMRNVIHEWTATGIVNPERIFDAGCGPLTLERWLETPIYGVDMNPHMIELGKAASKHKGLHAHVGQLSELPLDWKGTFDLVVASLVIDYSSLDELSHHEPERVRILRELVRTCNPHGLIWLTWNQSYQDTNCLEQWINALKAEGCTIRQELTGKIRAVDNPKRPCEFWSLVFSPNGAQPRFSNHEAYRLPFEHSREKQKRGSKKTQRTPPQRIRVTHQTFEILNGHSVQSDTDAAKHVVIQEALRWAERGTARRITHGQERLVELIYELSSSPKNAWRILVRLQELGIITA